MENNFRLIQTDILVVGAGLAGIMASIEAAKQEVNVCVVSSGNTFSGSSFYPGTWGFGLIGPESEADKADLKETIKRVGKGMIKEELVDILVEEIPNSIEQLKAYEVPLKEAKESNEREFIPCFDYKNRNWHGILQKGAKEALGKQLDWYGIKREEGIEIIRLFQKNGKVIGAMGVDNDNRFVIFQCKSVILASGGLGGLFQYRLNTNDITGLGQYLALSAGANLINLEFMQMMPGFLEPCYQTIFNEKVFRYSEFTNPRTGKSIWEDSESALVSMWLEERSTHGPFTSALSSKEVDFHILKVCQYEPKGVTVRYTNIPKEHPPEFIKTYFEWLKNEKHLTTDDEIQLGIFYHAANGGVEIDTECRTNVEGLFACGEVTGGMHGADRLGGLSTANGLVFGKRAGRYAGQYAKEIKLENMPNNITVCVIEHAKDYLKEIQELNSQYCMVLRKEEDLIKVLEKVENIKCNMNQTTYDIREIKQVKDVRESYRLMAAIDLTECMVQSMLARKESRGSHYRQDYKMQDDTYQNMIHIRKENGTIQLSE